MKDDSVSCAGSGLQEIFSLLPGSFEQSLVRKNATGKQDSLAVGSRVGHSVIVADLAQTPVIPLTEDCFPGHHYNQFLLSQFEKSLSSHTLLPGLSLHGQHDRLNPLNQVAFG